MPQSRPQTGSSLALKLACCVVVFVGIGATRLTIRQLRTQAAHEFASLRLRVMRVDEASARRRADIGRHIGPAELRERLAELDAEALESESTDSALVGLEDREVVDER